LQTAKLAEALKRQEPAGAMLLMGVWCFLPGSDLTLALKYGSKVRVTAI
jgi:hypothetical protein